MENEKQLTEKESLALIAGMINKAKNVYYETGITSVMWGIVVAVCSLEKFAELHFDYRLPFDIYYLTILAIIPQIIISVREKRKRIVRPYDETFMDYLWMGFGIMILLTMFLVNKVSAAWYPVYTEYKTLTGHDPSFRFYNFIPSFFLILYGMPTFVTGIVCKFKPMIFGGIFCWICSVIGIYTMIKVDLLLMASSAIVAWMIPGIIMGKEYRKAKKELMQADV